MSAQTTRERLIATASTLLETNGGTGVGLAELAEASGISNGSIYHHFGSKDGVLAAVLVDAVSRYQAEALRFLHLHQDDVDRAVKAVVTHRLQWVQGNRPVARLLLEHRQLVLSAQWHDQLKALKITFIEHSQRWLDHLAEIGALPRIPIEIAHPIVFAPTEEIARLWLRDQIPLEPTTFAEPLAAAAAAGLKAVPRTLDQPTGSRNDR